MGTALIIGLVAVYLIFAIGWAWARKIRFYSLVDALWAFSIGLTAIFWLWLGHSDVLKRLAAGILIAIWSIRLGSHLQGRLRKSFPKEDIRYTKLLNHWKNRESTMFFWFFQFQALSVLILAFPFLLVSWDTSPWSTWESIGLVIATAAICGEALADRQMKHFKHRNDDPMAVCREGLWRYSRHPNYFFESIIWLGIYLFTCGSHYGWATFHAPAIILFLLLRVTGIPPTEAASLARKGDAYRDYQRTTSAFIPLPPKTSHDQH